MSLVEQARDAFSSGLHLALLTGAGAAVLAAVAITFLLRRSNSASTAPSREIPDDEARPARTI